MNNKFAMNKKAHHELGLLPYAFFGAVITFFAAFCRKLLKRPK